MNKGEVIEQCLAVSRTSWAKVLEAMEDHASVAVLGNVLCSYDFTVDRDDWNRAKLRKGVKVRVLSEEHSEYVQRLAFEAGFVWGSGEKSIDNTKTSYLFINSKECLTRSDSEAIFNDFDGDEIFIEMPATAWAPEKDTLKMIAEASRKAYSGEQKEYSKEDFVEIGDSQAWSPKAEDLVGVADAFRKAYDSETEYEEIGKPIRAPIPDFDLSAGMRDLAKRTIDSGDIDIAIRLLELSKEVQDER